ncbi:MAG: SDR family NAD(P)-dependent oxidoreductase [Pseudomonadota bacterium]|uniref:SDR family NAD(P)-dependent oxidoreductase n=1 Tax=Spongiibacter marinus TaxID=354246 RepID=UPI002E8DCA8A|nr:SDR family NAD(P)-dependent oxidoreductase [Pseudomonadota bacterium]
MKLLEGKAAVVTGGARGIGKGHCEHLVANGAAVVVNDIDIEAAQALADALVEQGGKAIASAADIGTRSGCESLVQACCDAFGKIDIMINNAGVVRDKTLVKLEDDDFELVWRIHVMGTFWCSQAAARKMIEQGGGGAILNTTSGAQFGNFGQTNYSAAKGAIASMTYTWALELARKGIRVNAIGPLATTHMSATFKDADKMPYFDPAANGPMVCWLCSDEADNVTGQVFGTGGERISHMVQPHYGKTVIREGGWDIDSIRQYFQMHIPSEFGAFGVMGKPYPFHQGVKSIAAEAAKSKG